MKVRTLMVWVAAAAFLIACGGFLEQGCIVGVGHVPEVRPDADAGVVHDHVEAAVRGVDGAKHGLDVLAAGDVDRHRRRGAARVRYGGRRAHRRRVIDIRHVNMRALGREKARDGHADAVAGTCHEGDAVFEARHGTLRAMFRAAQQ